MSDKADDLTAGYAGVLDGFEAALDGLRKLMAEPFAGPDPADRLVRVNRLIEVLGVGQDSSGAPNPYLKAGQPWDRVDAHSRAGERFNDRVSRRVEAAAKDLAEFGEKLRVARHRLLAAGQWDDKRPAFVLADFSRHNVIDLPRTLAYGPLEFRVLVASWDSLRPDHPAAAQFGPDDFFVGEGMGIGVYWRGPGVALSTWVGRPGAFESFDRVCFEVATVLSLTRTLRDRITAQRERRAEESERERLAVEAMERETPEGRMADLERQLAEVQQSLAGKP